MMRPCWSYSASTRGVAVAQPQAGVLFPGVAEPDGFGQPGVAEGAGEQGHAAAVLHRLQLADVPGQDDLGAAGLGVGDQVGQVRAGQHRGLVDHQQGARADRDRAAGAAAAGQVAQELGGVVRHRDPGGQGVAGRLGRGDADHRAQPGRGPDPGGLGQHPGLAGPGRRVDHRHEPAVGQDGERGGGLVLAQPAARARVLRVARVLRSRACARPASASSSRAGSAPSACAACARVRRGAPSARACATMRSSMASCARVAYRVPPCRW